MFCFKLRKKTKYTNILYEGANNKLQFLPPIGREIAALSSKGCKRPLLTLV